MGAPLVPELRLIESLKNIGGAKLLGKLLRSFLDNLPVRLAEMRAHLAAGEISAAGRLAHKMKSSTGQLGMTVLQELGQKFETAAETAAPDPAALQELLAQSEDAFAGYRAWVETALRELPS